MRRLGAARQDLLQLGLAALLFWPFSGSASAASLFESDAVIDVRLAGPLSEVQADTESREYRSFILETEGQSLPLQLRLRGHSRVRVCDFPPLKLNFPQGVGPGTEFAGQDKLKLVSHCRNYDRGEQDLIEEYIAYRIFNLLTDIAYRVRMLRITYADTAGELPAGASPRLGFVIESLESVAARVGAETVQLAGLPRHRHDLRQAALVYVFQYLVANTDYMLLRPDREEGCCHNIDLLEKDGQVLMVPFDLDLSGLVNARYAYPDRMLRIDRVTQRLYRGLCTDTARLEEALATVNDHKAEILAVVQEAPGLTPDNAERARRYLQRFFDEAAKSEPLVRKFERDCVESY